MTVPLLDLRAQYLSIKEEIDAAIAEVLGSQRFILGPQVKACEDAIAAYCGCAHAVGVSSGTDALLIALMAEGIGPGDEVITTAYSFFATAGCIARLGAKPVFCDIDPVNYNLHPTSIAVRCTNRTKAILPVHLFGRMADMDPIMELARERNLVVIEDAAQAIGAEAPLALGRDQEPRTTRRAGAIGAYGCFSFFPSKNLGAFGDGGMVVTNDPDRAEKLRVLRAHGSKPKYYHKLVGGNFRLDTLQAAIVLAKLKHLDDWTAARQANARRYHALFEASGLVASGFVQLPCISACPRSGDSSSASGTMNGIRHVVNQYVIRAQRRNELQALLKDRGIGSEVYYPLPLHLQECFGHLGHKPGDFPESEKAAQESLALPVFPELSDDQARFVVDSISDFYQR